MELPPDGLEHDCSRLVILKLIFFNYYFLIVTFISKKIKFMLWSVTEEMKEILLPIFSVHKTDER